MTTQHKTSLVPVVVHWWAQERKTGWGLAILQMKRYFRVLFGLGVMVIFRRTGGVAADVRCTSGSTGHAASTWTSSTRFPCLACSWQRLRWKMPHEAASLDAEGICSSWFKKQQPENWGLLASPSPVSSEYSHSTRYSFALPAGISTFHGAGV